VFSSIWALCHSKLLGIYLCTSSGPWVFFPFLGVSPPVVAHPPGLYLFVRFVLLFFFLFLIALIRHQRWVAISLATRRSPDRCLLGDTEGKHSSLYLWICNWAYVNIMKCTVKLEVVLIPVHDVAQYPKRWCSHLD
jgi:hypothetical protein